MERPKRPHPKADAYTWEAYHERMALWKAQNESGRGRSRPSRRNASGSGSTVGGVAEAIVSGAMTVAGAYSEPQQSSDTTLTNFAESSQDSRMSDRDRELRGSTRDKGYGSSGSSRRR